MIQLTKEDFLKLKEYEKLLHQVVYNDFLRVVDYNIINNIVVIYKKYTNDNNLNLSCNNCILKLIKKIGMIYFNNKIEFINDEREKTGKIESSKKDNDKETEDNKDNTKKPVRKKSPSKSTTTRKKG